VVRRTLSKFLKPPKRGRRGYDKIRLFQWLMYKQVMGCSYRDLESVTQIDYSTFIKFRQRLMLNRWFSGTFKLLVSQIAPSLRSITAIIDSSFVETYSRRDEIGSEYFGYKEKNGFKLHQMIDYETRLPILQMCTPGARADIVWGLKLIRAAPITWRVSGILADKAYDAAELVSAVRFQWKKAKIGVPVRHTGHLKRTGVPESPINRKAKQADRYLKQVFLNKRGEIERYFSRKKRVFKLGEEKTRHLKNFQANCCLTSIMEILEWMSGIIALFTRLIFESGE
jgi:hypothetical protein